MIRVSQAREVLEGLNIDNPRQSHRGVMAVGGCIDNSTTPTQEGLHFNFTRVQSSGTVVWEIVIISKAKCFKIGEDVSPLPQKDENHEISAPIK